MLTIFAVIFLGLLTKGESFVQNHTRAVTCDINVSSNLGQPSPLLIYPGTRNTVRGSDGNGRIILNLYQNILIACPGRNNFIRVKGVGVQEAIATCYGGSTFSIDGIQFDMRQIICQSWPDHVNEVSGTCLWGKTLLKTGFRISTGFVEVLDACHDRSLHHTYYTKFVLGKDAAGFQKGVNRADWITGSFFTGLNPTNLYRRVIQRQTLAVLLGSTALAEHYIHMTNDYFLSKGHMVAKADFLFGTHQSATFWYTNAAPQWQTFNGGNWNALENDVRTFASRINADLDVYTGTYGRATLPDINGNEVDLYLTTTNQMPAPRLYWKILHNPVTLAGIAFVGLNNPYQSAQSAAQDVVCRDICNMVPWLTWAQKNLIRGYSYCCEVNEFRSALPDIPSFPVTSILR